MRALKLHASGRGWLGVMLIAASGCGGPAAAPSGLRDDGAVFFACADRTVIPHLDGGPPITGLLHIGVLDRADLQSAERLYTLSEPGGGAPLALQFPAPPPESLAAGTTLRLWGERDGRIFRVRKAQDLGACVRGRTANLDAGSHQGPASPRILVAVGVPQGGVPDCRDDEYTAIRGVLQQFYPEATNGNVTMTLDPQRYVTVNLPVSAHGCGADPIYATWENAIDTTLQSQGVNYGAYDKVLYFLPGALCPGFGGLTNGIPGDRSAIFTCGYAQGGWSVVATSAHELGHALGLPHAQSPGNEYGDYTDPMGSGGLTHFNAVNKGSLGWIPPSRVQTVTTSGRYPLSPASIPAAQAPLPQKIMMLGSQGWYHLSFRRTAGLTFETIGDSHLYVHLNNVLVGDVAPNQTYTDYQSGVVFTNLYTTNNPVVGITVGPPVQPESYFTVPPCRIMDTRIGRGGGMLMRGAVRSLSTLNQCNLPANARAISVNVTVTDPSGAGHVILYPGDLPQPPAVSTINYEPAFAPISNDAIIPLAGDGSATINIQSAVSQINLVLDISGYFTEDTHVTAPAAGPYGFQMLAPCRALDTRLTHLPLQAGQTQSYRLQGNPCGIPNGGVAALSLNATVIAPTLGGFVTLWPGGATYVDAPLATFQANTNVTNGARAALSNQANDLSVVYGTAGGSGHLDLALDVNGWFGSGLPIKYYPVLPCRAVDTRAFNTGGPALTANSVRTFQIQNLCGIPVGARAAMLNTTIVGASGSGYLTAWASGQGQPTVTGNSFTAGQGASAVGSIVPLGMSIGNNKDLSVLETAASAHLIVDVFGYFQ